jgi:chitodextrinase
MVAPAVLGLLAVVLALTGALEGNAAEPTRTDSFTAVADAFVDSRDPRVNFGSSEILRIDSANSASAAPHARGYVRFQVEGLNDPVIAAVLRMYITEKGNAEIEARDVAGSSWSESDVTWDDSPAIPDEIVDSTDAAAAGAWVSLDVTPLVRGNGEVSVVLTSSSSDAMAVSSREGQAPPELVVTTSARSPRNEVAPTISGRPQDGETLTAEPGSWTGSTPMTYAYEWQRCDGVGEGCAAIAGTMASHTLGSDDVGSTLRVKVVASNGAGSDVATSAPTAVVASASGEAPPPPPPPAPPGDTEAPSTPGDPTLVAVEETALDLVWNASTDNVGVASYGVLVDGAHVATVALPKARVDGLTCGTTYIVSVYASDAAGNRSPEASVPAGTAACSSSPPPPPPPADTNPPTTPTGLGVSAASGTSISLAWTPAIDNVAVTGYGVYKNGAALTSVTVPAATVSGLACGSSYTLAVDAFDAAGNRSDKASVTASTAPCADTQPPTAPTNVVASSRTATSIALSWSASSDNMGVGGYGLYRGGTLVGTTALTTGIFSGLTCNTSYTLAVDAYDAAGNRSLRTTIVVATTACPDTAPPSTPTGLAASSVTQASFTLTWKPSIDNVGVTGYDVFRNGTKTATVTSTSSNQTGLACGASYTMGVEAFDAVGNRSPRAQLSASTAACSPPVPSGYPASFFTGPAGQSIVLPSRQGVLVGAASSSDPKLATLEGIVGRKLDIEHRYLHNRCTIDYQSVGDDSVAQTVARGHIPLLSWSPSPNNGGQILRGGADACIRQLGQEIAAQPNRILLRPFWEFNGNWMAWSKDTDGSQLTTDEFRQMWIRVVNQLGIGGAFPKASMVWCPSEGYYQRPVWIDAKAAYPGDGYVDWVCSDNYNRSTGTGWREFGTLFSQGTDGTSVEQDFRGRKPYLVGETGTKEDPADPNRKGNWFRNARDYAKTSMPGMLGLVYFDIAWSDGDWRVATSEASKQGFRDLANDTYFNVSS